MKTNLFTIPYEYLNKYKLTIKKHVNYLKKNEKIPMKT